LEKAISARLIVMYLFLYDLLKITLMINVNLNS